MKKLFAITLAFVLFMFTTTALAYDVLQIGSKGESVQELQQALINQGYLDGKADGSYGKMTAASISQFQEANGIEKTGIADQKTQEVLFAREEERKENIVLVRDSKGADVKELQTRLIELGYFSGNADGSFDAITEAAVIVFQAHNGFAPTGMAGKAVRDVLYSDSAKRIDEEPVTAVVEEQPYEVEEMADDTTEIEQPKKKNDEVKSDNEDPLESSKLRMTKGAIAMDRDNILVTLTGEHDVYGSDNNVFMHLEVIIENNSDEPIYVNVSNSSINGWEIFGAGIPDIGAGKKKKGDLTFKLSDAEISSFEEIEEFELTLNVSNAETWKRIFECEPVVLVP